MKTLLTLFILISSLNVYAKNDRDLQKMLEEFMNSRQKMIDQFRMTILSRLKRPEEDGSRLLFQGLISIFIILG